MFGEAVEVQPSRRVNRWKSAVSQKRQQGLGDGGHWNAFLDWRSLECVLHAEPLLKQKGQKTMATLIWQDNTMVMPADGHCFTLEELKGLVPGQFKTLWSPSTKGVYAFSDAIKRKQLRNNEVSDLLGADIFGPCVCFGPAEYRELPESLSRRYAERSFYAPLQAEHEPNDSVSMSLIGKEQDLSDAFYCLDRLEARGSGGGRRVGIAVRDIVGAAGNRHRAGVVVLFSDWEPSEMEMGMPPGSWVRPQGWDHLLVESAMPREVIEEETRQRRTIFTRNMVYGVSGSSVIEVRAAMPAQGTLSASRSAEVLSNGTTEDRENVEDTDVLLAQRAKQAERLEGMLAQFNVLRENMEMCQHQAEAAFETIHRIIADARGAAAAIQFQVDRVTGDIAALRDNQARAVYVADKWYAQVQAEIAETKRALLAASKER